MEITHPPRQFTEEQLQTQAASDRFFEHFKLGHIGYKVKSVYLDTRRDGQWVVGWRRPESYPGRVEFVAAGPTLAEAYDNAVAGQRVCATTARLAQLDFECILPNGHEGECHLASDVQKDGQ